ncbi:MAG: LysR family transcriptional regulator [Alicyclobacillus sp.]|nr:LysR family transcriptional regulator [Alicyclobacillus sp.]
MELRWLESFLALCEELNFTRAAEKLNVSQPALSQQIKLLEDSLGAPLFHRNGRRVTMTQAGEILKQHSQRIFTELKQLDVALRELYGLRRGRITLGCSGLHLLASLAARYHRQYPDIRLSVFDARSDETMERVVRREWDAGLVYWDASVADERLSVLPLHQEQLYLVVPPHHPLAATAAVDVHQLVDLPLALLPPSFWLRQRLDRHVRQQTGQSLQAILELTTFDSLLYVTRITGVATVLTQSYLSAAAWRDLCVLPLVPAVPPPTVALVLPPGFEPDPALQALINLAKLHYAQLPAPAHGAGEPPGTDYTPP